MRRPSVLGSSLSITCSLTAVRAPERRVRGSMSQEAPRFSLWRGTSGTVFPAMERLVPMAKGDPARIEMDLVRDVGAEERRPQCVAAGAPLDAALVRSRVLGPQDLELIVAEG